MTHSKPSQGLAQSIATDLEGEILLGQIAAGTRLDEAALARRFGVSRTPVRAALQIVVARALAVQVPYRGVIVSDISPARLDQLFEAMGELEALCGRFAAQRMTAEQRSALQQLQNAMTDMARAGDADQYEVANTRFHQLIYTGSRNEDVAAMAEEMRRKLSPFRRLQLTDAGRVGRSHAEHGRIVEAIMQGDAQAADRALRQHLDGAAQAILDAWSRNRAAPMPAQSKAS